MWHKRTKNTCTAGVSSKWRERELTVRGRQMEDEGCEKEICHLVSQSARGILLSQTLLHNISKATAPA